MARPDDQLTRDWHVDWSCLGSLSQLEEFSLKVDYYDLQQHIERISEQVASHCSHLKRFKLAVPTFNVAPYDEAVDLSSLRLIPQLVSLKLPVRGATAPLQHCTRLTHLELSDWRESILTQVAELELLTSLSLESDEGGGGVVQLPILIGAGLPHLETLSMGSRLLLGIGEALAPSPNGLDQLHVSYIDSASSGSCS